MTAGAFLLALVAAAPNLEADQVLITCQVTAGGKEISGVSTSLSFSFVALAGDRVHLRLAAPIESFDSGHRAFDLALRRASEAGRHPLVEIEGVVSGGRFEGTHSRSLGLPNMAQTIM
ncbi:MAG: hypothetical protein ACXWLM_13625 [Myxococcales bacterium]